MIKSESNPITIKHLMTHSSGIPALDSTLSIYYFLGHDKEIPIVPLSTKEDLMRFINNTKDEIIFDPGEKFYYFNAGYFMLEALHPI